MTTTSLGRAEDTFFVPLGPIIPERDLAACHRSVTQPDGGRSYIGLKGHDFGMLNQVVQAQQAQAFEARLLKQKRIASFFVALALLFSFRDLKVVGAYSGRPARWYLPPIASYFVAAAFGGNLVSNVVLADYVLRSSSDLFANDWVGASLFALMTFFASAGIKGFERTLRSARIRAWYSSVAFAVSFLSFLAWCVVAAICFAPSAGEPILSLAPSGFGAHLNIALVLTTLIGDVGWSFINLHAAEQVLFGKRSVEVSSNSRYSRLVAERERLASEIRTCAERLSQVRGYLSKCDHGLSLTLATAEADVAAARELWFAFQEQGIASAVAAFLKA